MNHIDFELNISAASRIDSTVSETRRQQQAFAASYRLDRILSQSLIHTQSPVGCRPEVSLTSGRRTRADRRRHFRVLNRDRRNRAFAQPEHKPDPSAVDHQLYIIDRVVRRLWQFPAVTLGEDETIASSPQPRSGDHPGAIQRAGFEQRRPVSNLEWRLTVGMQAHCRCGSEHVLDILRHAGSGRRPREDGEYRGARAAPRCAPAEHLDERSMIPGRIDDDRRRLPSARNGQAGIVGEQAADAVRDEVRLSDKADAPIGLGCAERSGDARRTDQQDFVTRGRCDQQPFYQMLHIVRAEAPF